MTELKIFDPDNFFLTSGLQFHQMPDLLKNIYQFYYQGFKNMTLGRKLWTIILVKLIVIFLVLKLFFFPNFLKTNFSSDDQRSNHVFEQLTK